MAEYLIAFDLNEADDEVYKKLHALFVDKMKGERRQRSVYRVKSNVSAAKMDEAIRIMLKEEDDLIVAEIVPGNTSDT